MKINKFFFLIDVWLHSHVNFRIGPNDLQKIGTEYSKVKHLENDFIMNEYMDLYECEE